MSYALAAGLQAALYARLNGWQGLTGLIGSAVYDALPEGPIAGTYVVIGEEEARDSSDVTGAGALHAVTVAVISDASGFGEAKRAAAAICDALREPPPALPRGRIAGLWFDRARARRIDAGTRRRIDLRFRIRTQDDALPV
ncbi:DUF3168 domain-containing protein [Profundibacterium mesophilum]|uniref:DUF3168 domain-containing protein n=1 Tax=Profundibacterium mesophilum KAUST100406-0324 TaxID=1037889 RepID=A0A921TEL1_9RHOB|nr:DUF3168 domain-containing protein [Profundibacterium mesophilum]KAF0677416.1 hypothetical protein PMES_00202 [Profundibacterium mesophilum KAUST100406-0324]